MNDDMNDDKESHRASRGMAQRNGTGTDSMIDVWWRTLGQMQT